MLLQTVPFTNPRDRSISLNNRAIARFPEEFGRGDSYGALRYRFQWQLAIPAERFAIAL